MTYRLILVTALLCACESAKFGSGNDKPAVKPNPGDGVTPQGDTNQGKPLDKPDTTGGEPNGPGANASNGKPNDASDGPGSVAGRNAAALRN